MLVKEYLPDTFIIFTPYSMQIVRIPFVSPKLLPVAAIMAVVLQGCSTKEADPNPASTKASNVVVPGEEPPTPGSYNPCTFCGDKRLATLAYPEGYNDGMTVPYPLYGYDVEIGVRWHTEYLPISKEPYIKLDHVVSRFVIPGTTTSPTSGISFVQEGYSTSNDYDSKYAGDCDIIVAYHIVTPTGNTPSQYMTVHLNRKTGPYYVIF